MVTKMPPELLAIPAFEDNYIWLLHDAVGAVVVDPGEAEPILTWLAARRLPLEAILVTHHHGDHTAGIGELLRQYPCPVHGPDHERIPHLSHPLSGGECFDLRLLPGIRVMAVPGHTLGHLAYLAGDRLFCGDTLFSCGCGRLFEGTPAQMLDSLARLAALPDATQVCCAHEYTLANLRFALHVDPDNTDLRRYAEKASALRAAHLPTLPVTLAEEKRCNPFLRCEDATIQARIAVFTGKMPTSTLETFTHLREMKNHF